MLEDIDATQPEGDKILHPHESELYYTDQVDIVGIFTIKLLDSLLDHLENAHSQSARYLLHWISEVEQIEAVDKN